MGEYVKRFSRSPRPATVKDFRAARMTAAAAVPAALNPNPPADPSAPVPAAVQRLPIWLWPPENWENIDQVSYVLLPAIGTTVTIISFQVPIGRNGIIRKIANNFVCGGWVEGTGDVIWRVLVDGTPPPGATSYDSISASLGSPANPVEIPGFRIFENQVITLVGFNNPAGPSGGVIVAGQRLGGRLVGYLYPRDSEIDGLWI